MRVLTDVNMRGRVFKCAAPLRASVRQMSSESYVQIPTGGAGVVPPVIPSSQTQSAAAAKPVQGGTELGSILAQVQTLQADRERLQKELEASQGQIDKLQEGKRAEMQKMLDTVISRWLTDRVESEEARKAFVDGMDRLVKGTKESNGVWQVACQASNAHAKRLEELERLRVECTSLREQAPGARFKDEGSRKRERDDAPAVTDSDDVWASFEFKG